MCQCICWIGYVLDGFEYEVYKEEQLPTDLQLLQGEGQMEGLIAALFF
jgi:hypothetical protein